MLIPFNPRLLVGLIVCGLWVLFLGSVSIAQGSCQDFEPCVKELGSEDMETKLRAIRILGNLRDTRAVPPLVNLAKNHPESQVQSSSIRSLGLIADPSSVPALGGFLGGNSYLQDEAVRALIRIGGKSASQEFVAALENKDAQISALQGLAEIGDRDAKDPLRELYRTTEDEGVRAMASMAFQRIGARLGPTAEEMGLPIYPGARYSPNAFAEWIFSTKDPMDKVSEFYHQELKSSPLDFETFKKNHEGFFKDSREVREGVPPERPEIIFVVEQQSFEGKDYPSKLIFIKKGWKKTEIRVHYAVDG